MAAALQIPSPSESQLSSMNLQDPYSRRMTITELDLQDSRYPPLTSPSQQRQPASYASQQSPYSERGKDMSPSADGSRASWVEYSPGQRYPGYADAWVAEKLDQEPSRQPPLSHLQGPDATPQTQGIGLVADANGSSYRSPSGSPPFANHEPRRVSRDNVVDGSSSFPPPREQNHQSREAGVALQSADMGQRASGVDQHRDSQYIPSSPRHPSLPVATSGAGPSSPNHSPIVPMSAGPSYVAAAAAMAIPISPKPRAFAQQPTYINPSSANPSYAPPQLMREEICVECAMRDQDMADVDVTGPGVWERESDALYEELLQREELEESTGLQSVESASRPRAKGDRLTEEHIKMWLSVNPKEPSSRQQTLDQYVKAQRSLLEAEALAHARALRESRLLDDKMRDAYAQLRRSAYELGSSAQPSDDTGGVRIKTPRSTSSPIVATHSHSREVTLLENGMIVEHVDVKREEREERERRKKDEKRERSRVRKSSRSSRCADVMSVYSLQTPMPSDSGFFSGVRSDSRYSQSVQRPSSVMTGGNERPSTLLRMQSQASFSDLQSIGSTTSPRRSRFFGFKNLSSGWRSQDSLAPSGSMIDMHLALQKEQQYQQLANIHPDTVDIGSNAPTLRLADGWPGASQPEPDPTELQATKKRKGLLKFWKLVTGQMDKRNNTNPATQPRSIARSDDDAPLAPPPPLSYLVDQGASRRHLSTPSLPSAASPHTLSPYAASPPTAPSSLAPSPTSSRRSTGDKDMNSDARKHNEMGVMDLDEPGGPTDPSNPDSDSRGRTAQSLWTVSSATGPSSPITPSPSARPMSTASRRDKSLPPLPGESSIEFPYGSRPQTVFTYDPRTVPSSPVMNGLSPPQAAFRTAETRRQSFGGISSKSFSQTLPSKGAFGKKLNVPPFLAEEKYGEFGMSNVSIGQWPGAQMSENSLQVPLDKPKKRKSKFGLATLFGKKSPDQKDLTIVEPIDFNAYRNSQDTRYMSMYVNGHENMPGYASPMLSTSSHAPRMSVASKKNVETLVEQDPEFIAYRYPSNDQRLDLLR